MCLWHRLSRVRQVAVKAPDQAAQHGIGIAHFDHHGGNQGIGAAQHFFAVSGVTPGAAHDAGKPPSTGESVGRPRGRTAQNPPRLAGAGPLWRCGWR